MSENKYSILGINLSSVRNLMELKVIKVMNEVLPLYPQHDQL